MYDHEGFNLSTTMKPVKGMQHTEMPDQMTEYKDLVSFFNFFFFFLIKQNNLYLNCNKLY